jgi:hypothetical protein
MSEWVDNRSPIDYKMTELAKLTKRAVSGAYSIHGNHQKPGCAFVPSFGQIVRGGRVLPGKSNQTIAKILVERFPGIPVIGSFQIDDALRGLGRKAELSLGKPGQFYETRKVALATARFIKATNLLADGGVLVIAHQHHIPRADASIQAELPDNVETIVPEGIQVPWDAESSQLWTRGPLFWSLREPVAIARYAMYGWLNLNYAA